MQIAEARGGEKVYEIEQNEEDASSPRRSNHRKIAPNHSQHTSVNNKAAIRQVDEKAHRRRSSKSGSASGSPARDDPR